VTSGGATGIVPAHYVPFPARSTLLFQSVTTVATFTECCDFLRLLYAGVGQTTTFLWIKGSDFVSSAYFRLSESAV
jgi:hypothetical protein